MGDQRPAFSPSHEPQLTLFTMMTQLWARDAQRRHKIWISMMKMILSSKAHSQTNSCMEMAHEARLEGHTNILVRFVFTLASQVLQSSWPQRSVCFALVFILASVVIMFNHDYVWRVFCSLPCGCVLSDHSTFIRCAQGGQLRVKICKFAPLSHGPMWFKMRNTTVSL